jgi:hypothetical protein
VDFESLEAIIERIRADMKAHEETMMAILKAGLGEIKSIAEHQDVPEEEAALTIVGAQKERYGVRHQGNGGSRKKLGTTCRRMTYCAGTAWRKECGHTGRTVEQRRRKNAPGAILHKEPGKDGRSGEDFGRNRNATVT